MKKNTTLRLWPLLVVIGSAHATTVLLTDNFNESPANTSVGTFNDNLGATQGGTLANVTYSIQGTNYVAQHSDGGARLLVATATDGNGNGSVSLNNNFATQANAANQALRISFNIHSVDTFGDTTRWVQFNVGSAQHLDVANTSATVGVLFRVNGGSQILNGGAALVGSTSWAANDLVTITLSGTGGTGSAFNGNGTVATISIGGNNYGSFTLAQQSNAYLTFSGYNYLSDQFGIGRFDNLNVTLVPEPAATLLGGLGVLTLLRRRRSA
jgi:hypothetical protein